MAWTMERKTNLLLALFIGCLVSANLIGLKIANFGIFEASVGILVFPVLFLVTDIIAEVHGQEKAKEFVYLGLVVLVFVRLLLILGIL